MLDIERNKPGTSSTGHNIAGLSRATGKNAAALIEEVDGRRQRVISAPATEVAIRDARDDDAEGLTRIVAAITAEFPGCIFDLEADFPELKQPRSSFEAEGGRFWVAESQMTGPGFRTSEIVGCCGFLPADDPDGIELLRVYLRPDLRGSGLALKMFKIVQAVARQRGAGFIELWTDNRFKAAQRFYEKLGFTRQPGERLLNDRSRSSEYQYLLKLS
ncbi:MAG TPA: GNAT family N-acetyltransferase [Terriglobales bacterium]|nr:GNAT family N-acetyltransferase [Terriglobales bacterium]